MKKRRVLLRDPQAVADKRTGRYVDNDLRFKISLTLKIRGSWVYHDFNRIFTDTEDF